MKAKVFWTKLYHQFLVSFPVILIFILIGVIYTAYVCTYITVLLNADNENVNKLEQNYFFYNTSTVTSGRGKGIVFLISETVSMVMLVVCLLRTIFVNPGYFPSPVDFECKIILKNKMNIKTKNETEKLIHKHNNATYLKLGEDTGSHSAPPQTRNTDTLTISNLFEFDSIIESNPLTASDCVNLRDGINQFIDNHNRKFSHSDNQANTPKDEMLEIFKDIEVNKMNLCGTCFRWKVERSHHCRMCGKCVLKMDHHCPWLANCIGYGNFKYFCLVHLYGMLSTGTVLISYWETVVNSVFGVNVSIVFVWLTIFIYITTLTFFSFLVWLFVTNVSILIRGQTLIEKSDHERFPLSKSTNIYDLGPYKNFTNVFGKNPLVWLIPFFPNEDGMGMQFETNTNAH